MTKEKSAAVLTIHDAANMTDEGRADIARWLRRQITFLMKNNTELSSRYTARYLYIPID